MQNFVVHGFLGGIAEMNPEFVGGRADTPVDRGSFRLSRLNCSYFGLTFLRYGATRGMMLVGVPGKRKASPQLRNVVCNRKLA